MQHKKKNRVILDIAFLFEKLLAGVVLIAVFLGTIDVLRLIWETYIVHFDKIIQYEQLNAMLGQILLLVVGVELVLMLSLHMPGALIEALLYAIARKMLLIPEKEGMFEILLGVISIAGLFLIKKYLIDDNMKENENKEKDKTVEQQRENFICKTLPIFCKTKNVEDEDLDEDEQEIKDDFKSLKKG